MSNGMGEFPGEKTKSEWATRLFLCKMKIISYHYLQNIFKYMRMKQADEII